MKLEEQICTIELAKQLKRLGARQDSLFYYYDLTYDGIQLHYKIGKWNEPFPPAQITGAEKELVSAFTTAELGEMLPEIAPINSSSDWWSSRENGEWKCQYRYNILQKANTEANARAKMLIYLIEAGLIDMYKINTPHFSTLEKTQ